MRGQADCYFYRAISQVLRLEKPALPHAVFVDGGGKYALPSLISRFHRPGEQVRVIADFDVLCAETPLRDIVTTLGASWPAILPLWQEVCGSIQAQRQVEGVTRAKA